MISERTLKIWRKDALTPVILTNLELANSFFKAQQTRIIKLTQELMDLHLMRKED
jgi:hypothetical protein